MNTKNILCALSDLEQSTSTLNETSDECSALIQSVEKRLQEAGVGVTSSINLREDDVAFIDEEDTSCPALRALELRYGRASSGEYRLQLVEVTRSRSSDDVDEWVTRQESLPSFPEQWSRADRQLVVSRLDELISSLNHQTQLLNTRIRRALSD